MDEIGKQRGLCLVAMDRPGIGDSDFHPGRRLSDWPPLIEELARHLGWEKFHVFGVSGGGPYVLATAHAMPQRLLSANVICGAPPLQRFGTQDMMWTYRMVLWVRQRLPWLLRPAFKLALTFAHYPRTLPPLSWFIATLPKSDRQAIADEGTYGVVLKSVCDSLASGVQAVSADGDVYLDEWDLDVSQIQMPVHIWHGMKDKHIPWTYAQKVAALLPHAITHWTADDGHYSLPTLRVAEITDAALATASQRTSGQAPTSQHTAPAFNPTASL